MVEMRGCHWFKPCHMV